MTIPPYPQRLLYFCCFSKPQDFRSVCLETLHHLLQFKIALDLLLQCFVCPLFLFGQFLQLYKVGGDLEHLFGQLIGSLGQFVDLALDRVVLALFGIGQLFLGAGGFVCLLLPGGLRIVFYTVASIPVVFSAVYL